MKRNYPSLIQIFFLVGVLFPLIDSCDRGPEPPEIKPPNPSASTNPCEFPDEMSKYGLVWAEEFDGDQVDTTSWSFQLGDGCDIGLCGWGNNELQLYTDEPKNVSVSDGTLKITAVKDDPNNYSSARLNSKGKKFWTFGRFDIRAKLPKGQGLWPAIWMLSEEEKFGIWPKSGEIDIMELIGNHPDEIHGTVHYGPEWPQNKFKGYKYKLDSGDFSEGFHIFSVEWRANCIRWLVDGEPYGSPISHTTLKPELFPFNEKFHLLLNVAVGGNWPGNPDDTTVFPQTMEIDYIRVYEELE